MLEQAGKNDWNMNSSVASQFPCLKDRKGKGMNIGRYENRRKTELIPGWPSDLKLRFWLRHTSPELVCLGFLPSIR